MYCVSFSHVVRDVFSEDFRRSLNTNPLVSLCQDPPKYETVPLGAPLKNLSIQVTWNGKSSDCSHVFEQQEAYSLILFSESAKIQCQLVSAPKNWFQSFSFFSSIKYSGLNEQQSKWKFWTEHPWVLFIKSCARGSNCGSHIWGQQVCEPMGRE